MLASGSYILGEEAKNFEHEYARWVGTRRAVACASGTDAIALIFRSLNIGAGSTVVTVSHTAVATVAAIQMAEATPLLLDIESTTYTMNPDELASVLAKPPRHLPEIRAVLAVHLYGQACDLTRILSICNAHGVSLIEDCAQAHGASFDGQKLGISVAPQHSVFTQPKFLEHWAMPVPSRPTTISSPTGSLCYVSMAGVIDTFPQNEE